MENRIGSNKKQGYKIPHKHKDYEKKECDCPILYFFEIYIIERILE
jgi:hypothetical protein